MNLAEKFVKYHLVFIERVIMPIASSASAADDEIAKNHILQNAISQTTLGLCVVYHLAFVQSSLDEGKWNNIKKTKSSIRAKTDINWKFFDILKYVRDCFAHHPDGHIFPKNRKNTQNFLNNLPDCPELKIKVEDEKIKLVNTTIQQSYLFWEKLLKEI